MSLHALRCLPIALMALLSAGSLSAQEELLEDRWRQLDTPHFVLLSQASSRQTERFATRLELWRQAAAAIIGGPSPLPAAAVPNYVYLFDDEASFQHFTQAGERSFFIPTPRANFMALIIGDEESERTAFHYYAHFLLKNFSDLRLPRWYEEGLSAYLSRVSASSGGLNIDRFSRREYELIEQISRSLSMERLLYRDDALASPRVIQIANLKSEALLYYLIHGYQEEAFPDRRGQLQRYLQLLMEGRNPRFAFDQSFSVTTAQLDEEFHEHLLQSRMPRPELQTVDLSEFEPGSTVEAAAADLALMLAELALNSGRGDNAQRYFQWAIDAGLELARSYSGLGDALRFQEVEDMDQAIAAHFERALLLAPQDPNIIMDYGEYWEAELQDCEKSYPAAQRRQILTDIKQQFTRALDMLPNNPEANLAMAQVYLFEEEDWRQGVQYQDKAFSLLPADSFIMEQAVKYAIAASDYAEAERLITEIAQPIHFFGEPEYVTNLRERLLRKQRGEPYDACDEF